MSFIANKILRSQKKSAAAAISTWVEGGNMPSSSTWRSIAYGNGRFVASNGTNLAYSDNGIDWASSATVGGKLAYGGGKFVSVKSGTLAYYSDDGINWNSTTISSTSRNWNAITYGNGRFVALNTDSIATAYSTDGITWIAGGSLTSTGWNSITYGNGRFVAVGGKAGGDGGRSAYSTDGATWTLGSPPFTQNWISIAYGNGRFVAAANTGVGNTGSERGLIYSSNGSSWSTANSPSITMNTWSSVAYYNGLFIAIRSMLSEFAYSNDGMNWTLASYTISQTNWSTIAFGGNKFVIMGGGGINDPGISSIKSAYMVV
jgi:hypothetical protein